MVRLDLLIYADTVPDFVTPLDYEMLARYAVGLIGRERNLRALRYSFVPAGHVRNELRIRECNEIVSVQGFAYAHVGRERQHLFRRLSAGIDRMQI